MAISGADTGFQKGGGGGPGGPGNCTKMRRLRAHMRTFFSLFMKFGGPPKGGGGGGSWGSLGDLDPPLPFRIDKGSPGGALHSGTSDHNCCYCHAISYIF